MLPMGKAILLAGKKEEEVGVTEFDFTMDWMPIRASSDAVDVLPRFIYGGVKINGITCPLICEDCAAYPISHGKKATYVQFKFATPGLVPLEDATYTAGISCTEVCSGAYLGEKRNPRQAVFTVENQSVSTTFLCTCYDLTDRIDVSVWEILNAVSAAGKTYPVFKFSLVKE